MTIYKNTRSTQPVAKKPKGLLATLSEGYWMTKGKTANPARTKPVTAVKKGLATSIGKELGGYVKKAPAAVVTVARGVDGLLDAQRKYNQDTARGIRPRTPTGGPIGDVTGEIGKSVVVEPYKSVKRLGGLVSDPKARQRVARDFQKKPIATVAKVAMDAALVSGVAKGAAKGLVKAAATETGKKAIAVTAKTVGNQAGSIMLPKAAVKTYNLGDDVSKVKPVKEFKTGAKVYDYLDKKYQDVAPAILQTRYGQKKELVDIDKARQASIGAETDKAFWDAQTISVGKTDDTARIKAAENAKLSSAERQRIYKSEKEAALKASAKPDSKKAGAPEPLSDAQRQRIYQIGEGSATAKKSKGAELKAKIAGEDKDVGLANQRDRLWKESNELGIAGDTFLTKLTRKQINKRRQIIAGQEKRLDDLYGGQVEAAALNVKGAREAAKATKTTARGTYLDEVGTAKGVRKDAKAVAQNELAVGRTAAVEGAQTARAATRELETGRLIGNEALAKLGTRSASRTAKTERANLIDELKRGSNELTQRKRIARYLQERGQLTKENVHAIFNDIKAERTINAAKIKQVIRQQPDDKKGVIQALTTGFKSREKIRLATGKDAIKIERDLAANISNLKTARNQGNRVAELDYSKKVNELIKQRRQLENDAAKQVAAAQIKLVRKRASKNFSGRAKLIKAINKSMYQKQREIQQSYSSSGKQYVKRIYSKVEEAKGTPGFARGKGAGLGKVHKRDTSLSYEKRTELGEMRTSPGYVLAKGNIAQAERVANARALQEIAKSEKLSSGKAIDDLTELVPADKKRYLNLAGRYVDKKTHEFVTGLVEGAGPKDNIAKFTDWYNKRIKNPWKEGKVVWSPGARRRNYTDNWINANISAGASFREQAKARRMGEWLTGRGGLKGEMVRGNPAYDAAHKGGLFQSNFSRTELDSLTPELSRLLGEARTKQGAERLFGKNVGGYLRNLRQRGRDSYGRIDDKAKFAMFKIGKKRGLSDADAVKLANKTHLDYSEVAPAVDFLRKAPLIGKPFVTYTAKRAPRLLESLLKHPVKTLKYPAAIYGAKKGFDYRSGDSPEKIAKERKNLPKYKQGPLNIRLPGKDRDGQQRYLDLTYETPTGELTGSVPPNLPSSLSWMAPLLQSDPTSTMMTDFVQGRSSFTGKNLLPPEATTYEQIKALADYQQKLWAPGLTPPIPSPSKKPLSRPFTEGGYQGGKLFNALIGKKDKSTGRRSAIPTTLLNSLAGIKFGVSDPKLSKEIRGNKIDERIKVLEDEIYNLRYATGWSSAEKADEKRNLKEKIKRVKSER